MMKPLWHISVLPCPAPRMAQKDRWCVKHPCVQRYHEFKDQINNFMAKEGISPSSLPDRFTADTDDPHIWDVRGVKVWCAEGDGAIEIYEAEKLSFERCKNYI